MPPAIAPSLLPWRLSERKPYPTCSKPAPSMPPCRRRWGLEQHTAHGRAVHCRCRAVHTAGLGWIGLMPQCLVPAPPGMHGTSSLPP